MRTKIISAFPGTGKSHFFENYQNKYKILDSDSSKFSWAKDKDGNNTKERNPNFPANYIKHIKDAIGQADYIFVSTHKEVREALLDNCIFFYVMYPKRENKEEYLKRYVDRKNDDAFVKLLDKNWDDWILEINQFQLGSFRIPMEHKYLADELSYNFGTD